MIVRFFSLVVGGLSLLSLSAIAQTAIEEVAVIGIRIETAISQLPNNISVLDNNQLERLAPVHIQQALSQVPGVNYQRGNGQESLPSIRSAVLTGAGACGSVLVLEEAIPVRGAGFCNVNELFDTHFEQAARIEVVRGANTAFYGSNSLTGAINVALAETGQNFLSLEFGENEYIRARTAISYGQENSSHGRVYLSLADDGGYRDESGYQQQKLSWRHRTKFGDWDVAAGLTATHLDQKTAGFITGLDSYRDPVLRVQNLDPEAFRKTQSLRAWVSFSAEIGAFVFRVTPYLRDTEMDFLQHFLPGDPLEQNEQSGFGWQSSLSGGNGKTLTWSVGIDADFTDGNLLQTQAQATRGSPFLQATIPAGVHYDYQVDARQLGTFAHLNWQPDEQWRVIAGLRYESMNYDYDNLGLDGRTRDDGSNCGFGGCRYSRPADRQDRFNHLSPKLELQYRISDTWRWHLAAADSFRAPQATELYRLQRAQIVADLDEVRARTLELGTSWSNRMASLALTVYKIDQRNVIIRDSNFFNVDGQKTESSGVELSSRLQFNDHWSARLVTAYADHQYASDQFLGEVNINGKEIDTAPSLVANASLIWEPNQRVTTELEVQHQGDYFLDPENLHSYPGHTLLNLHASYKIDQQWRVALRALNITDKLYAERADFTNFTDERYFPGEPRSLYGEIRWSF